MLDYFLITWITTFHISHLIMHGQNPTVDYAWFLFSSRQLIMNRWYRKLHLYHLTINIRHPTSCYENYACNFSALGSYFRHLLMFFVINAKFLSEKYPIQIYTKVQRFFIVIYLISPLFSKYVYLNKKQPFYSSLFCNTKSFLPDEENGSSKQKSWIYTILKLNVCILVLMKIQISLKKKSDGKEIPEQSFIS